MVVTRSGGRKALSKGVTSDESGIVAVAMCISALSVCFVSFWFFFELLCSCGWVGGVWMFQDVSSRVN